MKRNLLLLNVILLTGLVFPKTGSAQLIISGTDLDINNVNTRINNELSEFWDPISQNQLYEIPKGSGNQTIYAGTLWLGGIDPQGSLHMVAQTYNQNGETAYYPGPLDTINGTSADPNVWNQIWKVSKADIDYHILHWNDVSYVMPASIANWPGNAPAGSNFNPVLAPFFDSNGNSIYEPALGEFPVISGDMAVYFICNDNYTPSMLNVPAMGVEVHGMAYAWNRPNDPALNNSVFFKYQIGNYSGINYHDVYLSLWTDFDLGNPADDYIATDVGRNMVYVYNSMSQLYDPAQGLKFLSPLLTNSMSYQNVNNTPDGNPVVGSDFYNYMNHIWLDGLPLTFGGDGRGNGPGATTTAANYAFPGTTDPAFSGQDWSMITAAINPGDVRMIGSTGPFLLPAGGHVDVDLAYITGFAAGPLGAVNVLDNFADDIGARYLNGTLTSVASINPNQKNTMLLSPSMVDDVLSISFNNTIAGTYKLEILGVDGKLIVSKSELKGNTTINLSNLNTGMYLVRVVCAEGVMVDRIMKQ